MRLVGRAKHAHEPAESVGSDSMVASNPVDPRSGSLQHEVAYEAGPPRQARRPAPPSRAPARHRATSPERSPSPPTSEQSSAAPTRPAAHQAPGVNVEWGSFLHVKLGNQISSETAHPGDEWSGTLSQAVMVGD